MILMTLTRPLSIVCAYATVLIAVLQAATIALYHFVPVVIFRHAQTANPRYQA